MDYKRALYYTSPTMKGDDVEHVQDRLKKLGYYNGGIDGSFGPGCKQATIDFQRTNSLTTDGSIGPATWNVLFSSDAIHALAYTRPLYYTSPVMTGKDVENVQRRLQWLGFYNGDIDGSFGPGCKQAVIDFQRANGLSADGSVGPATYSKLFSDSVNTSVQYKRPLYYTTPTMKGDDVTHVQNKLKSLGFYNGAIDGSFGPGCKQAVIDFQRANGLSADGSVGPATWNKLFSNTSTGQTNYKRPLYYTSPILQGDDVVSVQRKLKEKGFYNGEIDGFFGPACDSATRNFQRANGLDVDGSIGPATWAKLFGTDSNSQVNYERPLYYTTPTMKGEDVKHVQRRLQELGFYNGGIDGSFGPGCKQAVIDFQRANGLDTDGSVGPATWNKLFNDTGSVEINYTRPLYYTLPTIKGEDVKHVQTRLEVLGHYYGAIDGSFGPACEAAVKNFQRSSGLAVDGSVGPATWAELFGTGSSGGSSGGNIGRGNKIFLDPGHGGHDSGAPGNTMLEKTIVLSIAKKVGAILTNRGYRVEYSRFDDTYVSLKNRATHANNWGADLFVSLHCNAFDTSSANGTECFTTPSASESTKSLSRSIANTLSRDLGLRNRGHKEANFTVLTNTRMPAILIETAFITNYNDSVKLRTKQDQFATIIANQIMSKIGPESPGDSSSFTDEELVEAGNSTGLFAGIPNQIEALNIKTPAQVLSIYPKVTAQLELSAVAALPGPFNTINFLNGIDSFTASWMTATGAGVDIDFKKDVASTVKETLEKFKFTQTVDNVKYSLDFGADGTLTIMLEAAAPVKKNDMTTYVFQRLYVTIHPSRLGYAVLPIPVPEKNPEYVDDMSYIYDTLTIIVAVALFGGTAALGALGAKKFAQVGIATIFALHIKDE